MRKGVDIACDGAEHRSAAFDNSGDEVCASVALVVAVHAAFMVMFDVVAPSGAGDVFGAFVRHLGLWVCLLAVVHKKACYVQILVKCPFVPNWGIFDIPFCV